MTAIEVSKVGKSLKQFNKARQWGGVETKSRAHPPSQGLSSRRCSLTRFADNAGSHPDRRPGRLLYEQEMTDEDPRTPYERFLFGMSHVIWVPAIIILGVWWLH